METDDDGRGIVRGKSIRLDGQTIDRAALVDCHVLYGGGDYAMTDVTFAGTDFRLDGNAANTVRFLVDLYRSGGKEREYVEMIFDAIRAQAGRDRVVEGAC